MNLILVFFFAEKKNSWNEIDGAPLTLGGIDFGRKWPHLQFLRLVVPKLDVSGPIFTSLGPV